MRGVKIVATLGPATSSPERVRNLILAGAGVMRLNFSHGSYRDHAHLLDAVRQTASELGRHVPVLQDLQGPKIRIVGVSEGAPVELVSGRELVIYSDPASTETGALSTTYPRLHRAVSPGGRILLDDGRMEVRVEAVKGQKVLCRVINGGLLGPNKGVNLLGADLDVPGFTDKDGADLDFGLAHGVDWVAMSFVRSGEDARPIRDMMRRRGVRAPVLAKIERPEALANLKDILRAFDGIMVARGDLGIEISPEEVPIWQKTLVREARRVGKVSVVATQMLESMMGSPRPTRAEASDVANAVLDGTDAVMLSGETSVGSYPVEAVSVMARIIEKAEAIYPFLELHDGKRMSTARAVAHAACVLARDLGSRAVAVLTRSGMSAHLVSRGRPSAPISVFTNQEKLARQLALWWGVTPILMKFPENTEEAISRMEESLLGTGMASPGDDVVVVGATPLAAHGRTNFLKVHRIKDLG